MKEATGIWDLWETGLFVGDNRSRAAVSVEPDWFLRKTVRTYDGSKFASYRWFQRADNSQTEWYVSNVKSIKIDRSIDTDIATCTIEIRNTAEVTISPEIDGQLGKPGFYTPGRGVSAESQARWNHTENNWTDIFTPNALIRTYEGWGGYENGVAGDVSDDLDTGNLTQTGMWMVDTVTTGTNGILSLKCRDVGKLLREQQMYPPLVPSFLYPVEFCRWQYENFDAEFRNRPPIVSNTGTQGSHPQYFTSTVDHWYGSNGNVHGHQGTDSLDGNPETFALSVGNSHPSDGWAADWWEYKVNDNINRVYIHPWAGNYTVYISVLENGVWVTNGEGPISYDNSGLPVNSPDANADIDYVLRASVPWERGQWYDLDRTYSAERIRLTFRNHTQSQWGPYYYRAGIRDVQVGLNTTGTTQSTISPGDPWVFGIERYFNPNATNEEGYWCVANDGQVFAFGDARLRGKETDHAGAGGIDADVLAIRSTHTGRGYWLMQKNGRIHVYGDAPWMGDSRATPYNDYIDMAPNRHSNGYYLLRRNGVVESHGFATNYGSKSWVQPPSWWSVEQDSAKIGGMSIETHPTLDGYWVVDGNGDVEAFGDVPDHGSWPYFREGMNTGHDTVSSLRRNEDGSGYWIVTGSGILQEFGACANHGEFEATGNTNIMSLYEGYREQIWGIAPTASGGGYWFVRADGEIIPWGDADYFGQPGSVGISRTDGNYKDYADIVKVLLAWSGFLLYEEEAEVTDSPVVYGNIESTGAYADECLGLDMFDKRPPLDAINEIKEIVGYLFYVDSEGAARFESPNLWSIGNFYDDGTATNFMPEVDERTVLTDYSATWSDNPLRSEVIISTDFPENGNQDTITTVLKLQSSDALRGMVKPAMWVNGVFNNEKDQKIMAELIALHIWFQQRTGNVTCVANPCIQPNDQIRIFERNSGDTYIHYVRSVSTQHDVESGQYMMTLTTNWLGDEDDWVITADEIPPSDTPVVNGKIKISQDLVEWLQNVESRTMDISRRDGFGSSGDPLEDQYVDDATITTGDTPITSGGLGKGSS